MLLEMKYSYSVVMINLPIFLSEELFSWGKKLIPDNILVENDEAGGREDEFHVTVKYGLVDSTPSPKLIRILSDFKPFMVGIDKVSLFKNGEKKGFDVVKCEVISEDLRKLNKKICDSCKFVDEYKTYNPHVTIAYVKPDSCNHLVGEFPLKDKFNVNEVIFSSGGESDGKRFSRNIKLGGN